MAQPDFYFNPFDADFRANPYPHFPALLDGPPRQLQLFMPTAECLTLNFRAAAL
jgi:hypothetical protein